MAREIINNLAFLEKLEKGQKFSFDDGHFHFKVIGKSEKEVITEVLKGGVLKSRKGVNVTDAVMLSAESAVNIHP